MGELGGDSGRVCRSWGGWAMAIAKQSLKEEEGCTDLDEGKAQKACKETCEQGNPHAC